MEYFISITTPLEELNAENDNIDVCVTMKDGRTYTFVVCTPDNLKDLMKKDGVPYLKPCCPMLVAEKLTKEVIERLVDELIEAGDPFLRTYGEDI